MTKYILNSGGLKNKPEKAEKFFEEVFRGLAENPKVLVCLFAQPREDWEFKFPNLCPRRRRLRSV